MKAWVAMFSDVLATGADAHSWRVLTDVARHADLNANGTAATQLDWYPFLVYRGRGD